MMFFLFYTGWKAEASVNHNSLDMARKATRCGRSQTKTLCGLECTQSSPPPLAAAIIYRRAWYVSNQSSQNYDSLRRMDGAAETSSPNLSRRELGRSPCTGPGHRCRWCRVRTACRRWPGPWVDSKPCCLLLCRTACICPSSGLTEEAREEERVQASRCQAHTGSVAHALKNEEPMEADSYFRCTWAPSEHSEVDRWCWSGGRRKPRTVPPWSLSSAWSRAQSYRNETSFDDPRNTFLRSWAWKTNRRLEKQLISLTHTKRRLEAFLKKTKKQN